jgi:hypothetical protein
MGKYPRDSRGGSEMDITRVEALGKEALELAKAMLRSEYNEAQSICAVARIEYIIKQIGGSARELILNAEAKIKAEAQLVEDEIANRVSVWESKYTCNPTKVK